MRLPRMRFSIWQIMVAVAVGAVIVAIRIETARMGKRSRDHQLRSIDHGLAAMRYDGRGLPSCHGPFEPPFSTRNLWRAAYHATMARKWAEAAEYPWLPVEPDPPEPD